MSDTKMCTRCLTDKPAGEFYPDRRRPGGLRPWCKHCVTRRIVRAHGYGGYTGGCRCDTCRAAATAYKREYRRELARSRA